MSAPAVARLSGPGEILAVLPSLCGFPPTESLVLLSLRGSPRRVGLTARVDLPPASDEAAVADLCVERLRADGADGVVLAVHSEHGRRESLVAAARDRCRALGLDLLAALHVQDGRWTSYLCCGPCCPPSGTALPVAPAVLEQVQAEQAALGRAVLASRDELVASVAAPVLLAAAAADARLDDAAREERRARLEQGAVAARAATLELAGLLLDQVADGTPVTAADAARLTVGLADVHARDAVAALLVRRSDELLSLLLQVARAVTPPADTPVCALLAWTAYARGDGALANVALDRALAGTPDDTLARLLRSCLDGGVRPEELRQLAGSVAPPTSGGRRSSRTPG